MKVKINIEPLKDYGFFVVKNQKTGKELHRLRVDNEGDVNLFFDKMVDKYGKENVQF